MSGRCPTAVWKMSEGIRKVFERSPDFVCKVSARGHEGVSKVSIRCLEGVLEAEVEKVKSVSGNLRIGPKTLYTL